MISTLIGEGYECCLIPIEASVAHRNSHLLSFILTFLQNLPNFHGTVEIQALKTTKQATENSELLVVCNWQANMWVCLTATVVTRPHSTDMCCKCFFEKNPGLNLIWIWNLGWLCYTCGEGMERIIGLHCAQFKVIVRCRHKSWHKRCTPHGFNDSLIAFVTFVCMQCLVSIGKRHAREFPVNFGDVMVI